MCSIGKSLLSLMNYNVEHVQIPAETVMHRKQRVPFTPHSHIHNCSRYRAQKCREKDRPGCCSCVQAGHTRVYKSPGVVGDVITVQGLQQPPVQPLPCHCWRTRPLYSQLCPCLLSPLQHLLDYNNLICLVSHDFLFPGSSAALQ